jgi:hypothetical protein
VVERFIRESDGGGHMVPLSRMNYVKWALLMKVQLQVAGLWDVVNTGVGETRDDRRALSAIMRKVPSELLRTLAGKDSAKAAWDTLKTMRLGVERFREAKAQTRRGEFDKLAFKPGEKVEAFAMRLAAITHDLELLGYPVSEYKQVTKLLRLVPRMYKQMAASIESLLDLKTMPLEELVGRLVVCEERDEEDEPAQSGRHLLLTEEEWAERHRQREHGDSSSKSLGEKKGKPRGRSLKEATSRGTAAGSGEKKKGACHYCGIEGHFAKECRKAKRDWEKLHELNLSQAEQEQEPPAALMLAAVFSIDLEPEHAIDNPGEQHVFLNEERIVPVPTDDDRWYLDSGASNHMTGNE